MSTPTSSPTIKHPTTLPIQQLQANPLQPREKMPKEELQELVDSIKQYGILEPLIVAHTPAGYQLIAGVRRWRAAQLAGLTEVPVIVKNTTPRGMLEMALIENVQRVDLSPIERAQAFRQLSRDFHFSAIQIAEKIGKSPGYVSNTMKLLELPDAIKDGLIGKLISEGHARALHGLEDERAMIEVYKQILRENASVRRAEELVRRAKDAIGEPPQRIYARKVLTSPQLDAWQHALQDSFGKKSLVKMTQTVRQTKVTFVFHGSPEETTEHLQRLVALTGVQTSDEE
jgi:ParB family chromosome partitioning protein